MSTETLDAFARVHRVVIRGESKQIYEKIYLAYWDFYNPQNPAEADAVEDIINNRWKIRRFEAIETNYFLMADTEYHDNKEYQDNDPDTQQRACFTYLIEKQPAFEACHRFLDRYQRANARAIRNLDRIRKMAGKPAIVGNPGQIEKEYPSNIGDNQNRGTNPTPPAQAAPPNPAPKREQGTAILELLLVFVLFTLLGQTLENACSNLNRSITSSVGFHSESPNPPGASPETTASAAKGRKQRMQR